MKYRVSDFDFVFLSFDEPNAEELYAKNLNLVPWCKRVHGVVGFDSAHRACADVSTTKFFVTIDGDNLIYPEFLEVEIEIDDSHTDHAWSWSGRNHINGLVYGNGGLKLWSKAFVYQMKSHENSNDQSKSVDFCWDSKYHDLFGCYSTSIINSTPFQAWRSGFREGVKMCLDRGSKVSLSDFHTKLWYGNISRLCIWSSVGDDIDNGIWAIYGARMGCQLTMLTGFKPSMISDYNEMPNLWAQISNHDPYDGSKNLDHALKTTLGLDVELLSPEISKFFKRTYMNMPRSLMTSEQIAHFMAMKNV